MEPKNESQRPKASDEPIDKELESILNRLRSAMRDQAIDLEWVQEKIIAELRQELYAYRSNICGRPHTLTDSDFIEHLKRRLNCES